MNGYGLILIVAPLVAVPGLLVTLFLGFGGLIRWRTVVAVGLLMLSYLCAASWALSWRGGLPAPPVPAPVVDESTL